ncbi:LGFP repeat-containing protein [Kineococcus terrestris]|uniref:LGFP repeat-containing protein n=1 Tax=Kineococcus terrestris TaxID=2044856 RepID=UPI0034DB0BAD
MPLRRRATLGTAAAAALAALALAAPTAASAAPPALPRHLPSGVDSLARYEAATTCGPVQPGTRALKKLILDTYGKQVVGDARACPADGRVNSEHHDGRALDWMLDARDPAQRALAEEFLTWLLGEGANGGSAVNARRLGVMYVIWDGRIWGSYRADEGWKPYTGPNPHTDHVHISLSHRGAAAETSWWTGETNPVEGKYAALGRERSALGAPVSAIGDWRSARRKDYQHGSIMWSARTQARAVQGAIAQAYFSGDRARVLGLPVTDEQVAPGWTGRFSHFENGSVYWSERTGAHLVKGAIRGAWAAQGWETGRLGYPTSDEHEVPGGRRNDFTGGSVTWERATGKVVVSWR